jgi:hypothetical protein
MQYASDTVEEMSAGRVGAVGAGEGGPTPGAAAGMRLLSAGVPLTLLLDLAMPVDSAAIAAAEGGSAAWLVAGRPASADPLW